VCSPPSYADTAVPRCSSSKPSHAHSVSVVRRARHERPHLHTHPTLGNRSSETDPNSHCRVSTNAPRSYRSTTPKRSSQRPNCRLALVRARMLHQRPRQSRSPLRSNPHRPTRRLTSSSRPAVSCLEDCPTPARQSMHARTVARMRAGVGQSLTNGDMGNS